jgi:hypothetical protein
MAEGLVRGEGFATDASIIKADAQMPAACWVANRLIKEPEQPARAQKREYLAATEQSHVPGTLPKAISLT